MFEYQYIFHCSTFHIPISVWIIYIYNSVLEITIMRNLIHIHPFLNMGSDFCRIIITKKIKRKYFQYALHSVLLESSSKAFIPKLAALVVLAKVEHSECSELLSCKCIFINGGTLTVSLGSDKLVNDCAK